MSALLIVACLGASGATFSPHALAAFPGSDGRIAFDIEGEIPNGHEIYSLLPDGSHPQRLTESPGDDISPSWSADGQRIAFVRAHPAPWDANTWIFTMNADGSDQRAVAQLPDRDYVYRYASPSFAPSGNRIVYSTGRAIHIVRPDGSRNGVLVKARRQGRFPALGRCCLHDPVWSPNGRRIAFALGPKGAKQDGIWTIRRNGSGLRQLTDPRRPNSDLHPDYSPDGRWISFTRRSGPLMRVRANGSRKQPFRGVAASGSELAYSPSGQQVSLTNLVGSTNLQSCTELLAMAIGGEPRILVNLCRQEDGPSVGSPSWQPLP